MASFIIVELDTTAPQVEIYAPTFTTREVPVEINIEASETITSPQEVYVLDEYNVRRNYSFYVEDNMLTGTINFADYPFGLARLYVRVSDTVGNISDIYEKIITIKSSVPSKLLELKLEDFSKSKLVSSDKSREVTIDDKNRQFKIDDYDGDMKEKLK